MSRRPIAGGAVLLLLALACTHPSAATLPTRSVAFLRAVATGDSEVVFDELRRSGYVRGENLTVVDNDPSLIHVEEDETAATLARWHAAGVDLIFAFSTAGARIAAATVPDIPVVSITNDPVATGLVSDPRRPDGSVTGVTFRVPADRTLDLAVRTIPGISAIALVYPRDDPAAQPHRAGVEVAARELGVDLHLAPFDGDDATSAVASLPRSTSAVFVSNSPTAVRAAPTIVAASSERGLPVLANSTFVRGAMIVLEPNVGELTRQLGRQAGRILRGASVADVPVEDPMQYRVVIDATAAAALGLDLAEDVLREADEVLR